MDADFDQMRRDLRAMLAWCGPSSPGGSLVELAGVLGAIVPVAPDRSVLNSVVYDTAEGLASALPELAAAYEAAGIRAWTVWTPERDGAAREALARAGHVLDAAPLAMICDLTDFDAPDPGDMEWTGEADPADVMAVNDASYSFDGTPFSDALATLADGCYAYLARVDGSPACGLVTLERDGSAGVYTVATTPRARGRGLAYRLLGQALADARERGCTVSTLQATKMGVSVYERLGFRTFGRLEMWERRRPSVA